MAVIEVRDAMLDVFEQVPQTPAGARAKAKYLLAILYDGNSDEAFAEALMSALEVALGAGRTP